MIDFNFAVKPISAHRHIAAEFGLVVTIGFVNDVNHHLIVPHLFGKVSDIPLFSKFVFPSAIYPAKIKIYFWKKDLSFPGLFHLIILNRANSVLYYKTDGIVCYFDVIKPGIMQTHRQYHVWLFIIRHS